MPKAPKTVTACVNVRSGATKVLLGKRAKSRCPKGWTKVTWNVAGRNGQDGKNGANGTNGTNGKDGVNALSLKVRDSAGNVIGTLAGILPLSQAVAIYEVFGADGGLYTYLESGLLYPGFGLGNGPVLFTDNTCAGTAYMSMAASVWTSIFAGAVGGVGRIVYRASSGTGVIGPARVWKLTSTTSTVAAPVPSFWSLDSTGACVAVTGGSAPAVGDVLDALASVPAPPDGVGRLTVG